MSNERYRVSLSKQVADELRRLGRLAHAQGRLKVFSAASLWVSEELERTPFEFGESRHIVGNLTFRCGFAGPLFVEYAIRGTDRVVFIRRFVLRNE